MIKQIPLLAFFNYLLYERRILAAVGINSCSNSANAVGHNVLRLESSPEIIEILCWIVYGKIFPKKHLQADDEGIVIISGSIDLLWIFRIQTFYGSIYRRQPE